MTDVIMIVARILVALLFVGSGIGHLTQSADMAGFAAMKKVPAPRAAVLVSGVVWLVCSALILSGWYGHIGAYVLAAALVPTTLLFHDFWRAEGPNRQSEQIVFNKNLALIGGLLALAVAFSAGVAGPVL